MTEVPGGVDANGDGIPDTPIDLDGDGIPDGYDTDGDGVPDVFDRDHDGVIDSVVPATGTTTGTGTTGGVATGTTGGPTTPSVPPTDVGTVLIHRLNNAEYNNTVRDLVGTSSRPANEFPLDGSGAGFDNIAQVLSLSATHLLAMQEAAELLAAEVVATPSIVSCDLAAQAASCAKSTLLSFVQRAWRRPVAETELSAYYAAIDQAIAAGDSGQQALAIVMEAALLSPHFLFRVELDPDPASATARPLNGYELASRLSYFLWSSMPDDTLFTSAGAGTLADPASLTAEVTRMLQDPKSQALVENFAGQWLYLRKLDEHQPNTQMFPSYTPELAQAMRTETEMLFADVAFNGAPIDALINADYTYLNSTLAQHYGMTAPAGTTFAQVDLTGNAQRPGGILSHGSILTVNSHQATTSPVLRGKWVMNQLLCVEVEPPPPDVDATLNEVDAATTRERLEQHRADPQCAACHSLMDPIGLGLENFDAVGAYRTTEEGATIDASGTLPDGSNFTGVSDLRTLIAQNEGVARCVVKNLYTYALGRVPADRVASPEHYDHSTMAALQNQLATDKSFAGLIAGIVQSTPFRQRRGTEAGQ